MTTARFPPKMISEVLDRETIPELNALDDAPRKLHRGRLLRPSGECKRNRHRLCSSSHCDCKCPEVLK
jgi:hypothetical protein